MREAPTGERDGVARLDAGASRSGAPAAEAAFGAVVDHSGEGHGEVLGDFSARYERALGNPRLSRNPSSVQRSWREARDHAVAETDFKRLRSELKLVKSSVVEHLDDHVVRFAAASGRVGVTVHRAEHTVEAARIVLGLARARGVAVVAKSKSMVSEEIDLNHVLAAAEIETVETDLGEWSVQLRGERPSHMVMEAVHLGRSEVGAVFTEALGRPVSGDDIGEQVRVARDQLLKVFFAAGMGLTGANALVAETSSVVMVTNEGNGRLCSSRQPVHFVLAGIENLVPTVEDATTQLRVLACSATAQRLTSYTTVMTGPTPGHEMHVVLR